MHFPSTTTAIFFALLLAVPCLAADAPLAGKFSDGKLSVDLAESAGAYAGTLTLGTQQFPASAHANGNALDGTFTAGGHNFPFNATLEADTLTLSTGGTTYTLKRQATPATPAAPANPLAMGTAPTNPAPATTDAPAGYTVEAATDTGKSLVTQKPNVTTIKAALESTFPDLATYFGARPQIGSAYQDAKDSTSGGATFSSNFNGHPIRGIVSCKLHDGGATVAVIFGRTDAPKSDWDKLTNPPVPAPTASAAAASPSNPAIPLQNYDFPDGTGSIGIADGWACKSPTIIHAVIVTGPADQVIVIGNNVLIQTPDSPMIKMIAQNKARMDQMNARSVQMGIKPYQPPPAPPMLAAPLTDPLQALQNLAPQFSQKSEFNHGPSFTLEKIISTEDAPTNLPNAKAAIITYTTTRTLNGNSTLMRIRLHLQTSPIGATAWMWLATSFNAPDATFDHDLPIMMAMAKSMKGNPDRIQQVFNAENQQMQQFSNQMAQQSQQNLENNARQFQEDQDSRNRIYQQQHDAQMQGYAQHNAQWQSDELQKSRNAADFIETIKGTRTVYDTQTGTAATADLNYVGGVVDTLNQAALDPNRFVQIPLRDEMYPIPPGK